MTRFDWLADILRQIWEVIPFLKFPWPWPCLTCPPTDMVDPVGILIGL